MSALGDAFEAEAGVILGDEADVSIDELTAYVDHLGVGGPLDQHEARSFTFDLLEALRYIALVRHLEDDDLEPAESDRCISEHFEAQADRLRLYIAASRARR